MRFKLWLQRFVGLLLLFILWGCQSHDEQYYRTHPHELFKALKLCETTLQPRVSCPELKKWAHSFQVLSFALRENPQVFGQKILKLESRCSNASLTAQEKQSCQASLELRYGVVKWFESPGASQ